jgi:dipeptidase
MRFCQRTAVVLCSVLLVCGLGARTLLACYAVVAGKNATADGSVLVGHAEQNGPGKIFLQFRVVPRMKHKPGEVVVLKDGGRYAEPAESYKYLWSENFGLAGSDAVMNEWGVICVSNGAHTKEESLDALRASGDVVRNGSTYMLRIELAKRAKTAREGIDTLARLIRQFGHGGSGSSFVIADPKEAWIFTAVMGKRWVAQRVPDDEVVLLPNVNIIQEINLADPSRFLASPDLISYAEKKGWYDPKLGKRFNFRDAYDKSKVNEFERRYHCDPRQWRGQCLITGREIPLPASGPLPFSVKPNRKLTVKDLREILSDHLEGSRFDKTGGYSRGSPHDLMNSSDGMICNSDNQEIAVFQLRSWLPPEIGCIYWRTTAAGCASVLTPWYAGITGTPISYHKGYDLKQNLTEAFHMEPPAGTYDYDAKQAYWVFTDLQNAVDRDYKKNIETMRTVWRKFESDEFAEQEEVDRIAVQMYAPDKKFTAYFLEDYCGLRAWLAVDSAQRLTPAIKGK